VCVRAAALGAFDATPSSLVSHCLLESGSEQNIMLLIVLKKMMMMVVMMLMLIIIIIMLLQHCTRCSFMLDGGLFK